MSHDSHMFVYDIYPYTISELGHYQLKWGINLAPNFNLNQWLVFFINSWKSNDAYMHQ